MDTRKKRQKLIKWDDWFKFQSSGHGGCIIKITANDQLNFARAIVTAQSYLNKENPDFKWNSVKQGSLNICI